MRFIIFFSIFLAGCAWYKPSKGIELSTIRMGTRGVSIRKVDGGWVWMGIGALSWGKLKVSPGKHTFTFEKRFYYKSIVIDPRILLNSVNLLYPLWMWFNYCMWFDLEVEIPKPRNSYHYVMYVSRDEHGEYNNAYVVGIRDDN